MLDPKVIAEYERWIARRFRQCVEYFPIAQGTEPLRCGTEPVAPECEFSGFQGVVPSDPLEDRILVARRGKKES